MVGLRREEIAVVEPHLVALLNPRLHPRLHHRQHLGIDHAQRHRAAAQQPHRQSLAHGRAAFDHQITTQERDLGRGAAQVERHRALVAVAQRAAPDGIGRAAIGAGDAHTGQPARYRHVFVERGGDRGFELQARLFERLRRIEFEIARLGPEIGEVARIDHHHALVERSEGVDVHRLVPEPQSRREAHRGDFAPGLALFGVQPGGGIAAAARLHRVDDCGEMAVEQPHRVHSHGKDVGRGHRRSEHERHRAVPHAIGVFHAAQGAIPTAAAAIEVAVGALSAVEFQCDHPRKLRGGGVGAVSGDRGIGSECGAGWSDWCRRRWSRRGFCCRAPTPCSERSGPGCWCAREAGTVAQTDPSWTTASGR